MKDLENSALSAFLVAACLFVLGLLVLWAFYIAYMVIEQSDQLDCANRSGKVEHYDSDRKGLWRCTVPTAERAP